MARSLQIGDRVRAKKINDYRITDERVICKVIDKRDYRGKIKVEVVEAIDPSRERYIGRRYRVYEADFKLVNNFNSKLKSKFNI